LRIIPQSVRKQGKEAIPQAEARAISAVMPGIMQEHPRLSLLVLGNNRWMAGTSPSVGVRRLHRARERSCGEIHHLHSAPMAR
jgi:hypothetical protein